MPDGEHISELLWPVPPVRDRSRTSRTSRQTSRISGRRFVFFDEKHFRLFLLVELKRGRTRAQRSRQQ